MTQVAKIPKIQDLITDQDAAFKNDQLKIYLNQNPPDKWVRVNKYANNSRYLPIDKVEYMLDVIFQEWKVEVLKTSSLFNAVETTIRLHYKNPVTGEWAFHDGVGAKELQTQAGTGTLKQDFSNINKSAVEIALPIAKTNAIKDAADHLGRIFGRDLNRTEIATYTEKYHRSNAERESLIKFIEKAEDTTTLEALGNEIDTNDVEVLEIFAEKIKNVRK